MLTSASSCKTMRVIWAPCRITPACAGNRVETSHAPPPKKNHPRLRGEQSPGGYITYPGEGSPPLARGTATSTNQYADVPRITPACAGNSKALALCARITGDHPRLRGEQQSRDLSVPQIRGSPPLARGTARILRKLYGPRGITPACAGNSGIYGVFYGDFWDHPRLRGEQRTKSPSRSVSVISPPLARGTAQDQHSDWEYRGITPACAGNRLRSRRICAAGKDHPRLRGEQVRVWWLAVRVMGSPPLARGTE